MAGKPKSPQQNPSSRQDTQPPPNGLLASVRTSVKASIIPTVMSTAILSILGWLIFISTDYLGMLVDRRIDSKLEKIDNKLQTTNEKLEKLGKDVAVIEAQLSLIIKGIIQPKTAVNAKQTSEHLSKAKKEGTKFNPELITIAGKEFISAGVSSSEPGVWNAALAFLDYRSFLNSALAPPTEKFSPIVKSPIPWEFYMSVKPKAKFNYTLTTGEKVPAERAAVLERIDSPLNAGEKIGFEFLAISGPSTTWVLDDLRLKNVIFKDITIHYEGGKLQMENVYFVNCSFNVIKKPNGKNFATAVLASAPATTFQAGG